MTELPAHSRILGPAEGAFPIRARLDRDGHPELRSLFEHEREGLFRFLWRLTGNASDAEDLLQDTFLTAWRKKDKFEARENAGAYLRRTAFRAFLNARRKSDRRAASAPRVEEPTTESAARTAAESDARACLAAHVRAAVDALPDDTREAFVLFRFEGLSCAEIARIAETTVDAVEGRIERAMKLLGARLRPHAEDLPEL